MTIQYVEQVVLDFGRFDFGRLDGFDLFGHGSTSRKACMHDMSYENNGTRGFGRGELFMRFRSAVAATGLTV
jgi:hypothetical protein